MHLKGFTRILLVSIGVLLAHMSPAMAQTLNIVGFGDSLMAGYELAPSDAFPARLEKALRERGHDLTITNAGVSGDTSSAGLARIDWSVPEGTRGVILELGANDALRGVAPEQTRANLEAMIENLKKRDVAILLVGIFAPPNLGGDYEARFNAIYTDLAAKHGLPLYPFFLDGVITDKALLLADGMHPNADGVGVMVERFIPVAEDFLRGLGSKG